MNNKGLVKYETIIVCLVVTCISIICLLPLSKCISYSGKVAYFNSVYNVVNKIQIENTLTTTGPCVYSFPNTKKSNIEFLYIIINEDKNHDNTYSVYSKMKNSDIVIDTTNFEDLSVQDDYHTWVTSPSATSKYGKIIHNQQKYNVCTYTAK